jgi:hypothetical protein
LGACYIRTRLVWHNARVVKKAIMENTSILLRVFIQGEGIKGVEHLEVTLEQTFATLKTLIVARFGIAATTQLFVEDQDDPPDEQAQIRESGSRDVLKVHVHGCRSVNVKVMFNGKFKERSFGPSATIARVKLWAAGAFDMSPEDATEHVLQLAGTHTRPSPATPIGTLASCPGCNVRFDLVPDERVNGASEGNG